MIAQLSMVTANDFVTMENMPIPILLNYYEIVSEELDKMKPRKEGERE